MEINILIIYLYIRLASRRADNEIRQIISKKLILILAPHPDDEIFGLGGCIIKILENGGKINIIFLTDGEGSGVWHDKEEIRKLRIELSETVCTKLNLNNSHIYRLHLSDGSVPHPGQSGFEETVESVKKIIDSVKPDTVFATHPLDYWPFDHVACANIVKEAVKQSAAKPQLWYYWVWALYNIRPWQMLKIRFRKILKIDITEQMNQKKLLMDIYLKSVTPEGKPWSGVLPEYLLKTFNYPFEIIERII